MKTTKRLIAMAAALTLTACAAAPVFTFAETSAEGQGNTISITKSVLSIIMMRQNSICQNILPFLTKKIFLKITLL